MDRHSAGWFSSHEAAHGGHPHYYGDVEKPGFLHRQLRGLVLLMITIARCWLRLSSECLGGPYARWLAYEMATTTRACWWAFSSCAAIVLALASLTVIYRVAPPGAKSSPCFAWCDTRNRTVVARRRNFWLLRQARSL